MPGKKRSTSNTVQLANCSKSGSVLLWTSNYLQWWLRMLPQLSLQLGSGADNRAIEQSWDRGDCSPS